MSFYLVFIGYARSCLYGLWYFFGPVLGLVFCYYLYIFNQRKKDFTDIIIKVCIITKSRDLGTMKLA